MPGDRGQPRLLPRPAVHPHLDGVDALVLGPGHPGHRGAPRSSRCEPFGTSIRDSVLIGACCDQPRVAQ